MRNCKSCFFMNKFFAKKIKLNNEIFDSKKEFNRYCELKMLLKAGRISNLERQKKYLLIETQIKKDGTKERPLYYIADFFYFDSKGLQVVEDVKGLKKGAAYQLYVIKRKLMLLKYGIEIKEL